MNYQGMRATVMGLGLFGGGVATARWLAEKGALVTVTDKAPEERLAHSLASLRDTPIHRYTLGRHQEKDFVTADLLVVNPAVRPANPWLQLAQKAGVPLTSEIEFFLQHCPAPIIAVTGSNGKSTTAAMIASILAADDRNVHLGGNIGESLLGKLQIITPSDWIVLELSSFQLHHLNPHVTMPETAVVTNFTPNHLNWHPDLQHYAAAKQRLLREQSRHGTAVFDPASPGLQDWEHIVQGNLVTPRTASDLPPLLVPGPHNRLNAALAAAAARSAGCSEQAIDSGLASFSGLPDRLQFVGNVNSHAVFNDSASTTPESTLAALKSFQEPIWLLAGGADKGINLDEFTANIANQTSGAVFYGELANDLASRVRSLRKNHFCLAVSTLDEALALSIQHAPPTAAIVLSPGCSSHDQFVNYRQRGSAFIELVKSYSAEWQRASALSVHATRL